MMTNLKYFCVLIVFCLVGCSQQSKVEKEVPDFSVDSLAVSHRIDSIYSEIFKAYLQATDKEAIPNMADFDRKYLSKAYLHEDSIITELDEKHVGEIGFRESDHWIQGQDWDRDLAYSIDSIHKVDDAVIAYLTITNCGTKTPLCLRVVKDIVEGWKIDDFITTFEDGDIVSERERMKEYIDLDSRE